MIEREVFDPRIPGTQYQFWQAGIGFGLHFILRHFRSASISRARRIPGSHSGDTIPILASWDWFWIALHPPSFPFRQHIRRLTPPAGYIPSSSALRLPLYPVRRLHAPGCFSLLSTVRLNGKFGYGTSTGVTV